MPSTSKSNDWTLLLKLNAAPHNIKKWKPDARGPRRTVQDGAFQELNVLKLLMRGMMPHHLCHLWQARGNSEGFLCNKEFYRKRRHHLRINGKHDPEIWGDPFKYAVWTHNSQSVPSPLQTAVRRTLLDIESQNMELFWSSTRWLHNRQTLNSGPSQFPAENQVWKGSPDFKQNTAGLGGFGSSFYYLYQ